VAALKLNLNVLYLNGVAGEVEAGAGAGSALDMPKRAHDSAMVDN